MLRLPGIQGISLTGPVDTGREIAAAGGAGPKRVKIELGGNDPAILLDDIDPSLGAERIFEEAFWLCGQVCVAITRVSAHGELPCSAGDGAGCPGKTGQSGRRVAFGSDHGACC